MDIARRSKKYVAKEEQRDEFFLDVRYKLPFKKKYADRTMQFLKRHHIELKDSLYHSDTLFHLHYITFFFNLYQSFSRAYAQDDERASVTLYKSYSELIEYLNKTNEKLSLATFYCMYLERPEKTGKILANASMYTLGSAFFILYASYLAHGNVTTKSYRLSDGTPADAASVAKQVLKRNMAEIEKAGVIAINTDFDDTESRTSIPDEDASA
jgi:hypothetical protein